MPEIERDYEAAQTRLNEVFPSTEHGEGAYTVSTRLEGSHGVSRLIHNRSGAAVGHVQWNNENGDLISFDIDPEHRLGGFNLGRLLKGSWRDSEVLGVAGPVHGELTDRGERLRRKIVPDNATVMHQNSFRFGSGNSLTDSGIGSQSRAMAGQEDIEQKTEEERRRDITLRMNIAGHRVTQANDEIRRANTMRDTMSGIPSQRTESVNWAMNAFADQKRQEISRLSNRASGQGGTPIVQVEDAGRSFNSEIGRPSGFSQFGIERIGCSLCNGVGTHMLVGKVPLLEPLAGESETRRIHRSVMAQSDVQTPLTISSNLRGPRNAMEIGNPLAHTVINAVPKDLATNSAIFASRESSSRGRSALIRIPVPCRCTDELY